MAVCGHPSRDSFRHRLHILLYPTGLPNRKGLRTPHPARAGADSESYAWCNLRMYLSDRNLGNSNAIFADGHGERVDPRKAYADNGIWNGLGYDPGNDPAAPDYERDPHVPYKWDPSSGQQWRY